jgi:serine/threonine-protein kinase HipA
MTADGAWRLAPAYDLTFSDGPGGEHATTIDGEGMAPTASHLLALADRHRLRPGETRPVLDQVRAAVADWSVHAAACGVGARTTAAVASGLDRMAGA